MRKSTLSYSRHLVRRLLRKIMHLSSLAIGQHAHFAFYLLATITTSRLLPICAYLGGKGGKLNTNELARFFTIWLDESNGDAGIKGRLNGHWDIRLRQRDPRLV